MVKAWEESVAHGRVSLKRIDAFCVVRLGADARGAGGFRRGRQGKCIKSEPAARVCDDVKHRPPTFATDVTRDDRCEVSSLQHEPNVIERVRGPKCGHCLDALGIIPLGRQE